jgi:hypothetical protein
VFLIESQRVVVAPTTERRRPTLRRPTTAELFFSARIDDNLPARRTDRIWLVWFRLVGALVTIILVAALSMVGTLTDDVRDLAVEIQRRNDALTLPTFEVPLTDAEDYEAVMGLPAGPKEEQ